MKKLLLSLAFIVAAVAAQAQEKIYLHLSNGNQVSYAVSEVDSITFAYSDPSLITVGQLAVATKTNVTATLSYHIDGDASLVTETGIVYSTDSTKLDFENGLMVNPAQTAQLGNDVSLALTNLSQETTYYAIAYAQTTDGYAFTADTLEFTTNGRFPVPEAVDLGLSVKWASWNVGAQSETDYGLYIGWGDPTGDQHSVLSSAYPIISPSTTIAGTEYDIAHVKWGGKWKMPTFEQFQELQQNCTWTAETINGISFWRITSQTNGNYIYLPRVGAVSPVDGGTQSPGVSLYWTAEQASTTQGYDAELYIFAANKVSVEKIMELPIRAIYDDSGDTPTPDPGEDIPGEQVALSPNAGETVDLGLSVLWANKNIGASSQYDNGDYFSWAETTTKDDYTQATYTYYDADNATMTTPDNLKHIATTKYDAARMNWGYKWRMPTQDELDELVLYCTWAWDTERNGYTITGPNGNSIFMPSSGYKIGTEVSNVGYQGTYWSDTNYDREATYLDKRGYALMTVNGSYSVVDYEKEFGITIRPVMDK